MNNPTQKSPNAYAVPGLIAFTNKLFLAAGCEDDKAAALAEILVEADLLGHTTHGLAQAAAYLKELENGSMLGAGAPTVISERPAAIVWDGNSLPGVWLTARAVDLACERARIYGLCAVTIRRSHHNACLAAYLQRATNQGLMVIIASSSPSAASVAPYGGLKPLFTPDPFAVGIPTSAEPILIDMSASITSMGLSARLLREGKRFPGPWVMSSDGTASDDPSVVFADPPGSILPAGGLDHGHKGYALALFIEALTQGLGGYGRAEMPTGWGVSTYVQVLDPELFAGLPAYSREMDWIAEACRTNPPSHPDAPVRLPGQAGLSLRRSALLHGVQLYPGVMESLEPWTDKFGLNLPSAI
jgi:LDH2 family malate/lactate/ureidoglycolate dehydrogenase